MLAWLTFWTRRVFVWDSPVHCRMFISIPGLYPPDSSSTFQSRGNRKCLQTLLNVPMSTGGQKSLRLRTTYLESLLCLRKKFPSLLLHEIPGELCENREKQTDKHYSPTPSCIQQVQKSQGGAQSSEFLEPLR